MRNKHILALILLSASGSIAADIAEIRQKIGEPISGSFTHAQMIKAGKLFDKAMREGDVDTMEALIAHFESAGGPAATKISHRWHARLEHAQAGEGEGMEIEERVVPVRRPARVRVAPKKKAKVVKKARPSKKKPTRKRPAKKAKPSKKGKKVTKKGAKVKPLGNLNTMTKFQLALEKVERTKLREAYKPASPEWDAYDTQIKEITKVQRAKGYL